MKELNRLINIIKELRNPQTGCPWDIKQTSASLIPNFIEELYETVEAIESGNIVDLKEELGDLLMHIIMQIEIANEETEVKIEEIINGISDKLTLRHPHVFGDKKNLSIDEVKTNWEKIKNQKEKKSRTSALDGIPLKMPAIIVAQRIQEKAASVGFDWKTYEPVIAKIDEEIQECKEAINKNDVENIEEEIGDLLFSVVNLSRKLNVDAESALRKTIKKFKLRFNFVEINLKKEGKNIYETNLEEMDRLWEMAKKKKSE
jgi:MazG family protein